MVDGLNRPQIADTSFTTALKCGVKRKQCVNELVSEGVNFEGLKEMHDLRKANSQWTAASLCFSGLPFHFRLCGTNSSRP